MRWTISLELTPDGNPPITYGIGTVNRPIADQSPEEIGLTLEEGQQLLRQLQVQIIASQADAYSLCRGLVGHDEERSTNLTAALEPHP